jgi:hypothetical protein
MSVLFHPKTDVGGETRYARPWRPVKPLEIMEVMGMRSVRHFVQRRCEVGVRVRKDVGCGGELLGEDVVVVVVEVELRRRKEREGRR